MTDATFTRPVQPQRIFIIGGAGSGKTTLAGRVASALDTAPVELDLDPGCDRSTIAARERWIVEGIFLYDIDSLLERADLIVWLDLPRRLAQRRIVTRHVRLSLLRRNRHPGLRKLIWFVQGMRTYYDKPAREPTSPTDWDALSRALTVQRLLPVMDKVRQIRTQAELRALRDEFAVVAN